MRALTKTTHRRLDSAKPGEWLWSLPLICSIALGAVGCTPDEDGGTDELGEGETNASEGGSTGDVDTDSSTETDTTETETETETDTDTDTDTEADFGPDPNPDTGADGGGEAEALVALQVVTGTSHACAVTDEHGVVCWGSNDMGQLGVGEGSKKTFPVSLDLSEVVELAAGHKTTCALTEAGEVHCWGAGEYGQLGDGVANEDHYNPAPAKVLGLDAVESIAMSGQTACAVRAGGELWCWGIDLAVGTTSAECGPYIIERDIPEEVYENCDPTPRQVDIEPVVQVSVGYPHVCARHEDGSASCWGPSNTFGALGNGTTAPSLTPQKVLGLSELVDIDAAHYASCAIDGDAKVWCWGRARGGLIGQGSGSGDLSVPTLVPDLEAIETLTANTRTACAVDSEGEVYCWGDFSGMVPGKTAPVYEPGGVNFGGHLVSSVDTSSSNTCVVTVDSEVVCRGNEPGNGAQVPNTSGAPVVF